MTPTKFQWTTTEFESGLSVVTFTSFDSALENAQQWVDDNEWREVDVWIWETRQDVTYDDFIVIKKVCVTLSPIPHDGDTYEQHCKFEAKCNGR